MFNLMLNNIKNSSLYYFFDIYILISYIIIKWHCRYESKK